MHETMAANGALVRADLGEGSLLESPDYGAALRSLHDLAPSAAVDALAKVAHSAGAVDVVVYLVDFDQTVLTPVPARSTHVEAPVGQSVHGSEAGRAFRERRLLTESRPEGARIWVPILEGSDCTGVVALTIAAEPDPSTAAVCEELGMLAGCAISLSARYTDLYNLVRRRKAMSLPASMQWDLLPPLYLEVLEASSAGVLEPAYDVGGDCFDHAVNGFDLDVVIMDAMGHGLSSSLTASLAMGTYRHDRREGQSLAVISARLDEVIEGEFGGDRFVTGQVARLGLLSGRLTWVNAGHPLPLLIRGGRVQRALECRPSLPWGMGGALAQQATEQLQAGDSVLFYTDGVIDGRSSDGEHFGLERLSRLVEQALASPRPSHAVLRDLIHAVLAYQGERLSDDAAMVWVTWRGGP
ncbi:MAG: PP2C family protein-serine/threonine phosphatase [Acidimicrobiales bacterium]